MNTTEHVKSFFGIKFVREVSALQVAKGFSLVAGFVGSVVFANVLGSTQYGIYALILSFCGIISALINFGVTPTTLTLMSEAAGRQDRVEFRNLVVYYLKISFLTNLFWLAIFIFAPDLTNIFYHASDLGFYLRLMAVTNALSVPFPLLIQSWQIFRRINEVSIWETVKKYLYIFLGIIFVMSKLGVAGIFYSLLLTEALGFFYAGILLFRLSKSFPLFPNFSELRSTWKEVGLVRYLKFGSLIAVDKNLNNIVENLPSMLLGALSTPEQAGIFKVAYTIGTLPKTFASNISRMLSSILPFKESSEVGAMQKYYHKVAKLGTVFSLLLTLGVYVGTMILFRHLYRPEYYPAIRVISIVLLTNLLMGFAVSFGPIVRTLKRMGASISLNLLAIALAFVIGWVYIPKYGALGGALSMYGWFAVSILLIFLIERWLKTPKNVSLKL